MYNRSDIMKLAHHNRREFRCSMSLALRMAWVSAKKKAIIDQYKGGAFFELMSDCASPDAYSGYRQNPDFIRLGNEYCDLWMEAAKAA